MKFLFIHATSGYALNEPLGILYLAGALKSSGHECALVIPELENDFVATIKRLRPDMIGYSCITGSQDFYLDINRFLKRRFAFVSIMGGPYPTFSPEIIKDSSLDIICRGEGELALLELADRFDKRKGVSDILNLWLKEGGKVIANGVRPLLMDLDSLPLPDRGVLYKYDAYRFYQSATFMTTRGCPFTCAYCFNHAYNELYAGGNAIRHKSVERVIREIQVVKREYRLKRITFQDDVFVTDAAWLKEFAKEYPMRVGLPFSIFSRPELLREDVVENLSLAGCQTVIMAIESGVETIRKGILNRNMSNDTITKSSGLLHRYKISLVTQNMIGLPTESCNDIMETVRLNIECKPDYAWVSIFQPYAGTKIYDYCRSNGLIPQGYENTPNFNYTSGLTGQDRIFLEKMHKLFAIIVNFPSLLPYVQSLVNIFPLRILKFAYLILKGYSDVFKQRVSLIDKGLILYLTAIYSKRSYREFIPKEIR